MESKYVFSGGDSFQIDARMYLTGKRFRYDPTKKERRLKPVEDQTRLGKEVSTQFRVECDRWRRYDYPMDTIFRLNVTVCRKTNKTSYYNYFDEFYLRSDNQDLRSKEEFISIYG